jgi:hypothetical protein
LATSKNASKASRKASPKRSSSKLDRPYYLPFVYKEDRWLK